jgi:V/A-type H+-transporting ATPase subunit D
MANMNKVVPTKSNLRRVKDELTLAKQGHNLLDQKRSILVMELMQLVDQATRFEEDADKSLAVAYQALQRAVTGMGRLKTSSIALSVNIDSSIRVKNRRVMGVGLPVIETDFTDKPPYYSPVGVSSQIDKAVTAFRDALKLMGHLSELKISIMRLSSEIKRTIRKVNALEKIAIPDARETIRFIENRLEENERDMFVLMKSVKKNLETEEEL